MFFTFSLIYAGYYVYNYDKRGEKKPQNSQNIEQVKKFSQIPEHLTPGFWRYVSSEQLKEKLKKIDNVNEVRPDSKQSMLHLLVLHGKSPEMIDILIKAGVDYNLKDEYYNENINEIVYAKALHYASLRKENTLEWFKAILKYDTEINAVGWKASLLNWAVHQRNSIEVIKFLLEKGADPSLIENLSGGTALINASEPNLYRNLSFIDPEVIQLLLDYKVDIRVKNKEGLTAYDYMRRNEEFTKTEVFKRISAHFQKESS